MDARRWANRRGGLTIRGPLKIYDSTPALVGGLFALREGVFREYSMEVFSRFFEHRLEIDAPEEIEALLENLCAGGAAYREYLAGEGAAELEASIDEAHRDHVFGVPIFVFRGELFWGHDRIPLLKERLSEAGLVLSQTEAGPDSGGPAPSHEDSARGAGGGSRRK
jgi:2-hydroxychromene-2-carboxylate isomerase